MALLVGSTQFNMVKISLSLQAMLTDPVPGPQHVNVITKQLLALFLQTPFKCSAPGTPKRVRAICGASKNQKFSLKESCLCL